MIENSASDKNKPGIWSEAKKDLNNEKISKSQFQGTDENLKKHDRNCKRIFQKSDGQLWKWSTIGEGIFGILFILLGFITLFPFLF